MYGKLIYALSSKGAEFVGVPYRGPRRRPDEALVADFFVQHQLTVNQIYAALKHGSLPLGVIFNRWVGFFGPLADGLRLIPDGYVELQLPSGALAAFLEVDLGHESLTIWKEKIRNYLQYALSGDYERRFGHSRFRVLVVATSERRLLSIRKVVTASTEKIFWFASLPSIHQDGFFAPVWLRPTGGHREPFVPLNQ